MTIPLAVKLSPYYSSFANFATAAARAGADGLVLFNRFYQPDLDLDSLDVVPRLELSHPWELRLPVRWIAILRPRLGRRRLARRHLRRACRNRRGQGAHGGRRRRDDDLRPASSRPEHVATVEAELRAWLAEHEYESVDQLRGSASAATVEDPAAFERANYMATLRSWTTPARAHAVLTDPRRESASLSRPPGGWRASGGRIRRNQIQ